MDRHGAQDLLRQGGRPLAVWCLDEQGERPASVSSYVRFVTVLFRQPWCCRLYGERGAFFEGCAYPIGRAAFAPFAQPGELYFEMVFGKLHGRGDRYKVEDGELRLV